MSTSRLAAVNNQDPRIHYQGEWSLTDASTFQNIGNFGPPLERSLHTTTTDSSFAFAFEGSYISALGTITSGDSNSQPTLQCFIDGVNVSSGIEGPANNVHLCTATLTDGPHELVVNVSATQNSPFYLDNLQFQPSANVPLNNATVLIPHTDPSITYSPEWTQLGGFTANMTQAAGAFANVTFIGNQLGWFGIIPGSEPHAPSNAEYSVDDGSPVSFTLPGLPPDASNTTDTFNIPFFTTEVLQQGTHTLTVRYLGNDSTTPLTLNNLLIVNASSPSVSEKPGSSPPASKPDPGPQTVIAPSHKGSTGAIVGGVVGGVVGLSLVIALFFMYRRHSRRKEARSVLQGITPFHPESAPFLPPETRQLGLNSSVTSSGRTKTGIDRTTIPTISESAPISQGPSSTITTATASMANPHSGNQSDLPEPIPSNEQLLPRREERNDSSNNPINATLAGPGQPIHIRHEDSGLRIDPSQSTVLELPPNYTLN